MCPLNPRDDPRPAQAELATFELLLTWRFPELAQHLTDYGLPPVLYCSQWLMTLFATPFPPAFCARVIDVLLQVGAAGMHGARAIALGVGHNFGRQR